MALPISDAKDRREVARETAHAWDNAAMIASKGLHKTTFSEALISALLALIIWPCTLLHGFFAGAMAARTLNPRSTYVAESRKKAKPNESLPIRNARCNTELIVAPQGARTLRELWELSVVKHWNLPCIHMRPVLREVTQKESFKKEDGSVGEREDVKVVLNNFFDTYTFGQVHNRVRAIGTGLNHLLEAGAAIPGSPPDMTAAGKRTTRASAAAADGTRASRPQVRHVALYAETKGEWIMTAQAAFRNNITITTSYATLGLEALAYSFDITDTRIIVTDEALLPQLVKIMNGMEFADGDATITADCAHLRVIVYIPKNKSSTPNAAAVKALETRSEAHGGPIRVMPFADLETLGQQHMSDDFDHCTPAGILKTVEPGSHIRVPTPDSTALIMFTSGTTGLPKGVQVLHRNMLASVGGLAAMIPDLSRSDVYIGYLPLAHILEVCAETAVLSFGASIGYGTPGTLTDTGRSIPQPDPATGVPRVQGDAPLLRPTLMAGVPAMFERVRGAVLANVAKKGKIASILFNMAFQARKAALKMSTDTPFWRWLMFDKIRTGALGGRLRLMLSGGGSLEPATEEFFTTVFCCPLAQGYGLTETCAAGTINWADDVSHGRVGPPVLCADIKLVDWVDGGYLHTDENPRGEIYIGGPSVTAGYYKQPEKTRESFFTDEDGFRWFASGDIGELMPGGVLRIIDRRKDLFKLSHGEYIAPSKIEGALLSSHYIEHVMIYADPTKDYCIAIAVPKAATLTRDFPELAQGGHALGLAALASNKQVNKVISDDFARICKERKFNRSEQPRKVLLSPEEWTPDNGMLTETLKLKRHAVSKKFKEQLAAMYTA